MEAKTSSPKSRPKSQKSDRTGSPKSKPSSAKRSPSGKRGTSGKRSASGKSRSRSRSPMSKSRPGTSSSRSRPRTSSSKGRRTPSANTEKVVNWRTSLREAELREIGLKLVDMSSQGMTQLPSSLFTSKKSFFSKWSIFSKCICCYTSKTYLEILAILVNSFE